MNGTSKIERMLLWIFVESLMTEIMIGNRGNRSFGSQRGFRKLRFRVDPMI